MIKQFRYKNLTWLDLESPSPSELDELGRRYDLHPLILEELARPSERARVDVYSQLTYLILHLPLDGEKTIAKEIDFVLGRDFIITTHYEPIDVLNDFAKILETDFNLKHHQSELQAGFIFFHIIKELYEAVELGLNRLNTRLRAAEEKVFHGEERLMVWKLSEINHQLMDYRWALKAHGEILTSLETPGEELFGRAFAYYLKALGGEQQKIWNILESNHAAFLDLRDTNDSLLTIKTGETTRVLTVTAFILLPMTIVSSLFGLSSPNLPLVNSPYAFYLVLSLMILASILTYALARFKKWI